MGPAVPQHCHFAGDLGPLEDDCQSWSEPPWGATYPTARRRDAHVYCTGAGPLLRAGMFLAASSSGLSSSPASPCRNG